MNESQKAEVRRDALEKLRIVERGNSMQRIVLTNAEADALLAELKQAEARLASVPALVEALRPFTEWDFEKEPSPLPPITLLVFREDQERARAALTVYEQSQSGDKHRGWPYDDGTPGKEPV